MMRCSRCLSILGLLCLAVGPSLAAVYMEDFSTGAPGWVGGYARGDYSHADTPYYYWDPASQALYVQQPNKRVDGDDHYFCHPVDYDGGSFALSFDMYVTAQQYDAALRFGLSTNPNDAWSNDGRDPSCWSVSYGRSDAGPGTYDELWDGHQYLDYTQQPYSSEGYWWHHQLTYDATTRRVETTIWRRDTPSIVSLHGIHTLTTGFTSDMDWLVLSDNRRHTMPSTWSQTYGIGCLDNISFTPEPASFLTLVVGALALTRRR